MLLSQAGGQSSLALVGVQCAFWCCTCHMLQPFLKTSFLWSAADMGAQSVLAHTCAWPICRMWSWWACTASTSSGTIRKAALAESA